MNTWMRVCLSSCGLLYFPDKFWGIIAGNFKLDSQLPHLLEGKLSWVRMLAAKKKVKLSMIDSTVATEFGLMKKLDEDDSKTGIAIFNLLLSASRSNCVLLTFFRRCSDGCVRPGVK